MAKKQAEPDEINETLPHYDFSGGVRGKYADRIRKSDEFRLAGS